jgi:hypothetical protein
MFLQNRRGLTLIEIMVLITIIAVLAGLILPVLARAKQTSYQPRCSSHLNQIAKGLFMYADAAGNSGMFGPAADPFNDPNPLLALNLIYGDYVQDARVFSCGINIPAERLAAITPIRNGVIDPKGTYLSPLSCSYAYDPGHHPDHAVTAIVADRKGGLVNSDNHGANRGQNVLISAGTVEYRESVVNPLGKIDGQDLQDDDIYSLNPEIAREFDSYLRQIGSGVPPAGNSDKENPPSVDNSGAGQCVLIGAGPIKFRDTPSDPND